MFWVSLAAKMLTSAAVVASASYLVERSGPLVGAMIATLPLSAGPAYVFLAMDHGPDFLRQSAVASLIAIAGTGIFIVIYAAAAQRRGTVASLALALAGWLAAAAGLSAIPWTLAAGVLLNVALFSAAMAWCQRFLHIASIPRRRGGVEDMLVRAGSVMALVAVVVLTGRAIGPSLAGLLALAPVVMTSLVLILHPRIGGRATAAVMVHSLPGMLGFVAALTVMDLTVERLGAAVALSLALATSLVWNGGILFLKWRPARQAVTS